MHGELAAAKEAAARERGFGPRGERQLLGAHGAQALTLLFVLVAGVYYAAIGYVVYLVSSALS